MDLFEYQAKELFRRHDIPTLQGTVVSTTADVASAVRAHGLPAVIKAQVKVGGRGKAGGVKVVHSIQDAEEAAGRILGMDIKGHTVHSVLVEPGVRIAEEYYLSVLLDRAHRSYLVLCSVAGGMDIEEVAATRPEDLARVPVDPCEGLATEEARRITQQAQLPTEVQEKAAEILCSVYDMMLKEDATLVEINPLVRTEDGELYAVDGKVTLDNNAEPRHREIFQEFHDPLTVDAREYRAQELGLNYVKLDGTVGIIGNGAGLVMSTLDVVAYAGEQYATPEFSVSPANFLDIGGGASASVMEKGLRLIMEDPQVEAVFVNVFGGITSCVEVAHGIVQAVESMGDEVMKPLVIRLDGNAVEEGRAVLAAYPNPYLTVAHDMDEGAETVARIAAERLRSSCESNDQSAPATTEEC